MLRELNLNEMDMVSGGSRIKTAREEKARRAAKASGKVYYNGNTYDTLGAADVARRHYEGLPNSGNFTNNGLATETEIAGAGAVVGAAICAASGVGAVGSAGCGLVGAWIGLRLDDWIRADIKYGSGRPGVGIIPTL